MSKPNRIKAFIFDIDGTIVNNTSYHTKAKLQFLSSYDIHIAAEELYPKIFGAGEEILHRFFWREVIYKKKYKTI